MLTRGNLDQISSFDTSRECGGTGKLARRATQFPWKDYTCRGLLLEVAADSSPGGQEYRRVGIFSLSVDKRNDYTQDLIVDLGGTAETTASV